jgi:hypothetical protein
MGIMVQSAQVLATEQDWDWQHKTWHVWPNRQLPEERRSPLSTHLFVEHPEEVNNTGCPQCTVSQLLWLPRQVLQADRQRGKHVASE